MFPWNYVFLWHHKSKQPKLLTAKVEKRHMFGWVTLLHRPLENLGCKEPWIAPVSEKAVHSGPQNQKDEESVQMAYAKALGAFGECDLPEQGW